MDKVLAICDYSHDYDGFAFEEENCKCAIYVDEGKYYLCGDCEKRINLDDDSISGDYNKIPLTEEELQLSMRELCMKYCLSKWAKNYDIHNRWDRFKDTTPIMEIIKQSGK